MQFHILSKESETLAALGLPIGPYDGAAEFYVNDLKDLLAVFGGEEYQQVNFFFEHLAPTISKLDSLKCLLNRM